MDNVDVDTLLFERNVLYPDLKRALDLVIKFIVDKKLILKGGQAIDYSLRLKKSKLYEDNAVPDYDFLSSNHYQDAIELGNTLCKANLPNVSIINAMHPTTMRVRINFITVADITYCPKNILSKLKTLKYNNIIILHPIEQVIDIHRSLSHGWENTPDYVCLHRWEKDVTRLNMILKYYFDNSKIQYKTRKVTIPKVDIIGSMVTGTLAEALIKGKYKVEAQDIIVEIESNFDKIEMFYLKDDKRLSGVTYSKFNIHNPYMEYFPKWWEVNKSYGKVIVYELSNGIINADKLLDIDIYVANYNHILMMYLTHSLYDDYSRLIEYASKNKLKLSLGKFGGYNDENLYFVIKFYDRGTKVVPKSLFPKEPECDANGEFDYRESIFFKIDGL
jgi:hypothetical protein